MKNKTNRYSSINNEDLMLKLLSLFSDEVLLDFQSYISELFKLPTSLWAYDRNNQLKPLYKQIRNKYYPEFCLKFNKSRRKAGYNNQCNSDDIIQLDNFLKNEAGDELYKILRCHMGLSRIVFPINVNDKIVGALLIGKFLRKGDESIITSNLNNFYHQNYYQARDIQRLKDYIIKIPTFSNTELDDLIEDTQVMLPLLEKQYRRFQEAREEKYSSIYDHIIFLDKLDKYFDNIFLSYDELWEQVDLFLREICDYLCLKTAICFFSDSDDYRNMAVKSAHPKRGGHSDMSMKSNDDLLWLERQARGVLLPVSHGPLLWLNDYLHKTFLSNDAIIYAKHVFSQRLIFLGFGFNEKILLSNRDKLTLRFAVDKLLRYIEQVSTTIEIEKIMSETGHKLRRTHGEIKGGINALKKYGQYIPKENSVQINKIITTANNSLESGLNQLDLITRNYHAFARLSTWLSNEKSINELIAKFDLLPILHQFKNTYSIDLKRDKKSLRITSEITHAFIVSIEEAILLMFWNIIDNAIKFSYNTSEILIKISESDESFTIQFKNSGQGFPEDEKNILFNRNTRSRYRDPLKDTSGTGVGLSTVKRFFNFLFPNGHLDITSYPDPKIPDEKRRHPGDHYLTIFTMIIPKNVFLKEASI